MFWDVKFEMRTKSRGPNPLRGLLNLSLCAHEKNGLPPADTSTGWIDSRMVRNPDGEETKNTKQSDSRSCGIRVLPASYLGFFASFRSDDSPFSPTEGSRLASFTVWLPHQSDV